MVGKGLCGGAASALAMLVVGLFASGVAAEPPVTLRGVAELNNLRVGAMFLDGTWKLPQQQVLVAREFNCLTLNLTIKRTRPARGRFDWGVTEESARWAERFGIPLLGHCLVFPHDKHTPDWIVNSPAGEAQPILDEHLLGAIAAYRGRVAGWVVVNEAVSPGGGYRDSYWLRSLGPGYVNHAHRVARRLDPSAVLIYNDHDIELADRYQTRKWRTAQQILRGLAKEGTVDALGWQLHTTVEEVLSDRFVLEERMRWAREELGLKNYVTELDVVAGPGETLIRQAEAYRRVTQIWRRHSGGGWLQTWGVYDGQTHLGPAARPLLFDTRYQAKPAHAAVRHVLAAP